MSDVTTAKLAAMLLGGACRSVRSHQALSTYDCHSQEHCSRSHHPEMLLHWFDLPNRLSSDSADTEEPMLVSSSKIGGPFPLWFSSSFISFVQKRVSFASQYV